MVAGPGPLPRPGRTITFDEMRHFLEAQRIALAHLPERLVLLGTMPITQTGKVQKFVLREQARALAGKSLMLDNHECS